MLDKERRENIQKALSQRNINKYKRVGGQRFDIPCGDHNINIVYYSAEKKNASLFLGFHGGGFLFGGNAFNDHMWKAISQNLGVNVASVEYRKSPQYQYQHALEDAIAAYLWFQKNAEKFDFNRKNISVIGFSAGANLAATLCLALKNQNLCEIRHQILIYPYLDAATDPTEKGANSPLLYLFNELHSSREAANSLYVSPVLAERKDLQGLPETWICVSGHDALKTEGYRYGEMLREAGVPVHVTCAENMPHEFFEAAFGDYTEATLKGKTPELYRVVKSGAAHEAAMKVLDFLKRDNESE